MVEKIFTYKDAAKPTTAHAFRKTEGGFQETYFYTDKIEQFEPMADDQTAILLVSGVRIEVSIPVLELQQAIEKGKLANDAGVIDLIPYTGENNAVLKVRKEKEQEDLRLKQQLEKEKQDEKKKITDKIGTLSEDGVFFGVYEHLGKKFNAYAAPEDLKSGWPKGYAAYFNTAQKRLASLQNWHGFDGVRYDTEESFKAALQNGDYKGQWFMPTFGLLYSETFNLFSAKNAGAFSGTLGCNPGKTALYYWSITKSGHDTQKYKTVGFKSADLTDDHPDLYRQSCRPVRLVPIP